MNVRTTVVLLLVAIAVGILVFRESGKEPEDLNHDERMTQIFPKAQDSDFTAITIQKGEEVIELQRGEGDSWRMVKPVAMRADKSSAKSLISSLMTLWTHQSFDPPGATAKDLEQYGLDKPTAVVTATVSGKSTVVEIGCEGVRPDFVYIRLNRGGKIMAASASVQIIAGQKADDFVEKKPLRVDTTRITRIEYVRGESALTLARGTAGWGIEKPVQDRADDVSIGGLLIALIDLGVTGIAPAGSDEAKAGLAPPAAHLALTVEGEKEPRSLTIGAAVPEQAGKLFARVGGVSALLVADQAILDRMNLTTNAYRLRRVFDYTAEGVQKFEFSGGAGPGACERQKDAWALPGNDRLKAHATGVMKIIDALRGLGVQQFIDDAPKDLAPYGLAAPRLTLSITPTAVPTGDAAGPVPPGPPVVFQLGGPAPGSTDLLCLKRGDRPFVVGVPKKWADWLEQGVLNCVDPVMFTAAKEEILGVTLEKATQKIVLAHEIARDAWTVTEPKDRALNPGMWMMLLNEMTKVESRGVVSTDAQNLAAWALDKPSLRVILDRKAPAEGAPAPPPMVLRISSPDGEGRIFGHVEGGTIIFQVDRGVVDTLLSEPFLPVSEKPPDAPAAPPELRSPPGPRLTDPRVPPAPREPAPPPSDPPQ